MLGRLRSAGASGSLGAGGGSPGAATPSQDRFRGTKNAPGPVPGRITASAEKPARPKTGSGKAGVPRWALRASPARPQPVPGGRFSKEEKPTPPATRSGRESRPKTHPGRSDDVQSRNYRRPQPVLGARTSGRPGPEARSPRPSRQKGRGLATRPPPGPGPGQPAGFGQTASYSQQQSSPRA